MSVSSSTMARVAAANPHGILARLLDDLLGKGEGERFLVTAVSESRRSEVPAAREDVLAFARAHIVSNLTVRVGPRLVTAFLDELANVLSGKEDLGESTYVTRKNKAPSSEPGSSPGSIPVRLPACSIFLCLTDRFARAAIARVLVRAGCVVEVADPADGPLTLSGAVLVLVIDGDAPHSEVILASLVRQRPELPVIVLTNVLFAEPAGPSSARRVHLLKSARPAEIVEEIRILLPTR